MFSDTGVIGGGEQVSQEDRVFDSGHVEFEVPVGKMNRAD